jgi:N-acyl homoserine lactone hydrolase
VAARRIVLLTLGWEDLPKSVSVHGAPPDERLREPTPGVLVETEGGWLLLDTGFNTALVRDPALRRRFFPHAEYVPVLPGAGEPLPEAMARAGLDVGDVVAVALSHLHADHAGGLKLFAGRVPVHAQRREVDFGLRDPRAEREGVFRIDFDDPRIDWRLADGDVEIAPGVRAVSTPGHTPGHQSFVVDVDDERGGGGFVFAFDAADLTENIERELPIGSFVDVSPEETVEPIRRLKRIAAERGHRLVPGHDPQVWPALTAELSGRFGPRPL